MSNSIPTTRAERMLAACAGGATILKIAQTEACSPELVRSILRAHGHLPAPSAAPAAKPLPARLADRAWPGA